MRRFHILWFLVISFMAATAALAAGDGKKAVDRLETASQGLTIEFTSRPGGCLFRQNQLVLSAGESGTIKEGFRPWGNAVLLVDEYNVCESYWRHYSDKVDLTDAAGNDDVVFYEDEVYINSLDLEVQTYDGERLTLALRFVTAVPRVGGVGYITTTHRSGGGEESDFSLKTTEKEVDQQWEFVDGSITFAGESVALDELSVWLKQLKSKQLSRGLGVG